MFESVGTDTKGGCVNGAHPVEKQIWPGNSLMTAVLRKSVLVPGLIVTFVNPFGVGCSVAPEPVIQKNTSTFNGMPGTETLL